MTCFYSCLKRKGPLAGHQKAEIDEEVSKVQNVIFYSYKELHIATEGFSDSNKIGEGGFGSVYKGRLKNGTIAAIKVLSPESRQGVKEFLTEIQMISDIEHENLVKLHGCCVEGDHRILVYGYLQNNSLAQTLLGSGHTSIQFNWATRSKICLGVASGLAFLHEEVQPHIIHRDIKASNILLDRDLTPKISDFGLAKLIPSHLTHVSTRVAGTPGYLAPEYAIQGHLTRKADIYSFGVLLLEIVSGRCNRNKKLPAEEQYLLERAWEMHESGELVRLVDTSLEGDFNIEEALRFLKVALLCTQVMPKLRPSMRNVLKLLKGEVDVADKKISRPGLFLEFMSLKADQRENILNTKNSSTGELSMTSVETATSCATMTFTSILDRTN